MLTQGKRPYIPGLNSVYLSVQALYPFSDQSLAVVWSEQCSAEGVQ